MKHCLMAYQVPTSSYCSLNSLQFDEKLLDDSSFNRDFPAKKKKLKGHDLPVVDFLEDVFESTVIFLEDSVFGTHVKRVFL